MSNSTITYGSPSASLSNKKEILKLIEEKEKRLLLDKYRDNFALFVEEQVKIIPKDSSRGFIPFNLNEPQKIITEKLNEQLKETGKVRAIILKARQQGISTYCTGRVFWKSYFSPHSKSVILAHDSATSDNLFTMSKNLISNMQGTLKPKEIRSNAKEIILKSPSFRDKEAVAGYRLYTAGSPEAGRGTTPTILHASEVAFWQHDEKILAGLFQGVSNSPGTEVILESTANGATGEFYRLWKGAVAGENEYMPIFLPWFLTSEYRAPAPEGMELTLEEEKLKEDYDLDNDQLFWRRIKIGESTELKFKQEYPSNADEAFLVSGSNVFDIDKLNQLIPQQPTRISNWDPSSKMFEDGREGKLLQWQYPEWETPYIIAADVSLGVGQDYSVAVVMDAEYKVVAMYRDNRIDPSTYGEFLFYLSRYYNNAFLLVESNNMGIATLQKLESMGHSNLYKQTKIANVSNDSGERLGFRTTQATKPVIIGNLKKLIEDEGVLIPSNIMIQELKDYISTATGKTEAAPGTHDDTVMALAMGCEVLRTHGDKLSNNNISWKNKINQSYQDDINWL